MLFRSPLSRYALGVVGVITGLVFALGDPDKWQNTPSLRFLHRVPWLPLDFWGWLAVAYGSLMLFRCTKTGGYAVGAFLFAVMAVCLLSTLPEQGPKNIFAVQGVVVACMYHLVAIRFSVADRFTE